MAALGGVLNGRKVRSTKTAWDAHDKDSKETSQNGDIKKGPAEALRTLRTMIRGLKTLRIKANEGSLFLSR